MKRRKRGRYRYKRHLIPFLYTLSTRLEDKIASYETVWVRDVVFPIDPLERRLNRQPIQIGVVKPICDPLPILVYKRNGEVQTVYGEVGGRFQSIKDWNKK